MPRKLGTLPYSLLNWSHALCTPDAANPPVSPFPRRLEENTPAPCVFVQLPRGSSLGQPLRAAHLERYGVAVRLRCAGRTALAGAAFTDELDCPLIVSMILSIDSSAINDTVY